VGRATGIGAGPTDVCWEENRREEKRRDEKRRDEKRREGDEGT
jgi:hypothetical protein